MIKRRLEELIDEFGAARKRLKECLIEINEALTHLLEEKK
jgi:hypothetical protein